MKKHLYICVLILCAACASSSAVSEKLTAAQAKDYVGKKATVCGVVASATYAVRSRRQPTFLNLDAPYPSHIFTAVIWGEDRGKFGQPEVDLKGKRICVSGLIETYRDKPQIVLRERSQLATE